MADEILNLNQALTDERSALDAKKQEITDGFAIKNTEITDLQGQIVTKDARILELETQLGTGIDPAAVTAATTQIQGLTSDIASLPTK